EDPQGDQGRKDPVQPAGDGGQRVRNDPLGEDVSERQVTVLEELTPQKSHLLPEPLLARVAHPWSLLAADGCVGNHPLRKRGPSCLGQSRPRTCRRTTCHSSRGPERASAHLRGRPISE